MVHTVSLTALAESPDNPRRTFDATKLEELAASLKTHGLLQPLIVRPQPAARRRNGTQYEIVAGARRFRAAQLAGVAELEVIVRELSDEQALDVMLIENLQRDDLAPLEEAASFRALVKTGRHSAASIAQRVGKSEKYVWDRMKLLDLLPEAKGHLDAGAIAPGHAILLARLAPADQQRAIDPERGGLFTHERDVFDWVKLQTGRAPRDGELLKSVTVRELEAWIADHVRFDARRASAAAPLDFGPVAERVAQAQTQPGRGKKVLPITRDHYVKPDARADERTYCVSSWKRADGQQKSTRCEAAVLGVVVTGPGYGEAFEICVDKACDVHWKAERRARERAARGRDQHDPAARAKEELRRKAQQAREEEQRKAWERAIPAVREACGAKLRTAPVATLGAIVFDQLAKPFQTKAAQLGGVKRARTAEDVLRVLVAVELLEHERYWDRETLTAHAKRLGVDVGTILAAAAREPAAGVQTSAVPRGTKQPTKRTAKGKAA